MTILHLQTSLDQLAPSQNTKTGFFMLPNAKVDVTSDTKPSKILIIDSNNQKWISVWQSKCVLNQQGAVIYLHTTLTSNLFLRA